MDSGGLCKQKDGTAARPGSSAVAELYFICVFEVIHTEFLGYKLKNSSDKVIVEGYDWYIFALPDVIVAYLLHHSQLHGSGTL